MEHDTQSQRAPEAQPLSHAEAAPAVNIAAPGLQAAAHDAAPTLERVPEVRAEPERVRTEPAHFIPTIDDAPLHTAADFAAQEPLTSAARFSGLWRQTRAGLQSVAARWPVRQQDGAASAPTTRASRFPMLAASLAVAAGIGAAGGAAGFAGAAKLFSASSPAPAVQAQREFADEAKALKDAITQMRGSIRTLSDHVAALRTNVEAVGRTTGSATAKLNEQVGKLHEQVAKLHDAPERADKSRQPKQAATIPAQHAPTTLERAASALERSAPAAQPPAQDVTGSIPAPAAPTPAPRPAEAAPPPKPGIVDGWTLRRVYDGVALIEGRQGEVEVEPGDMIRGVGRVQDIRRQDGRWVVVTSRGLIVSR